MKVYDAKKLNNILSEHKKWLESGGVEGRIANLIDVDLKYESLIDANLRGADLRGSNLIDAVLRGADLRGADLRGADLRGAKLIDAVLSDAVLIGANLIDAVLRGADLRGADLRGADGIPPICCPEKGSFIAFKKASDKIIELFIPTEAKRCSATSRKCRCNIAKVISITNKDGSASDLDSIPSNYDDAFIYIKLASM